MTDQPKHKKIRLTEDDDKSLSNSLMQDDVKEISSSYSESDTTDKESDDDSVLSELNINVEFCGRSMEETDAYAIQKFLDSLFLGCDFIDTKDLANLISMQTNIGCVVTSSGDDEDESEYEHNKDIFAFISILNMADARSDNTIHKISAWSLNNCPDPQVSAKLKNILSSHKVCMLLSERFLDIPPKIALELYGTLMKDLLAEGMKFDYYWIFLKTFSINGQDDNSLEFAYPECELLFDKAELKYTIKLRNDEASSSHDELIQCCSALLINAKEFEVAIENMKILYAN